MADPDFFRRQDDDLAAHKKQLQEMEEGLAECYARWERLEAMESRGGG